MIDQCPCPLDLVDDTGDERLAAKPWVDGHDQQVADKGQDLLHCGEGRCRANCHSGCRAQFLDLNHGPMQVRACFNLNRDRVSTCGDEIRHIAFRFDDHEMRVQRQRRAATNRLGDGEPERNVGHEPAIHYVEVDVVDAGPLRRLDLFS
jgi:hypothetical protein